MKRLKVQIPALILAMGLVLNFVFNFATPAPVAETQGSKILEFDTMSPVTGPFVTTDPTNQANAIRNISGGGLPWRSVKVGASCAATGD